MNLSKVFMTVLCPQYGKYATSEANVRSFWGVFPPRPLAGLNPRPSWGLQRPQTPAGYFLLVCQLLVPDPPLFRAVHFNRRGGRKHFNPTVKFHGQRDQFVK